MDLKNLFSGGMQIPNLVVGINQVDNLGDWNLKLNLPTEKTKKDIERKSNDLMSKLIVNRSQIEYFSALRGYRLIELLGKLIQHSKSSSLPVAEINPMVVFDKEVSPEMPDDVRTFYKEKWQERKQRAGKLANIQLLIEDMRSKLTDSEKKEFDKVFLKMKSEPTRIGILGKTGVGKTTTVNNLFRAKFKASRTVVGTTKAQYKDFELPDGSIITIVDMPGYGRSIKEDTEYEQIYLQELPKCDIILLMVQANSRDFVDDQEMIKKIAEWNKNRKI